MKHIRQKEGCMSIYRNLLCITVKILCQTALHHFAVEFSLYFFKNYLHKLFDKLSFTLDISHDLMNNEIGFLLKIMGSRVLQRENGSIVLQNLQNPVVK